MYFDCEYDQCNSIVILNGLPYICDQHYHIQTMIKILFFIPQEEQDATSSSINLVTSANFQSNDTNITIPIDNGTSIQHLNGMIYIALITFLFHWSFSLF